MVKPQNVTIGGVQVDKTQILKQETVTEKNGKQTFIITFKNGVVAKYEAQNPDNHATISSTNNTMDLITKYNKLTGEAQKTKQITTTNTEVTNGYHIDITGTYYRDNISLSGCNGCNVDISQADGHTDAVNVQDNKRFKSQHNKVKQAGDHDPIYDPDSTRIFKNDTYKDFDGKQIVNEDNFKK